MKNDKAFQLIHALQNQMAWRGQGSFQDCGCLHTANVTNLVNPCLHRKCGRTRNLFKTQYLGRSSSEVCKPLSEHSERMSRYVLF